MENIAIEVRGLTVTFGHRAALSSVDLELPGNSIIGLIGPSGSGKTTLIRCIAGLLRPNSGSIHIAGHRVPDRSLSGMTGYMPQESGLYLDLTGIQNLSFFAALHGLRGKEAAEAIRQVFRLTELEGEERKRVSNYSGGMKKRLSLAAALLNQPPLLILDEPTVGVDPVLRAEFWEEFRRLTRAESTVLVSTHVMDEADRCDYLVMVFEGEVLAIGSPEAIRRGTQAATTEEAFLALRMRSNSAAAEEQNA